MDKAILQCGVISGLVERKMPQKEETRALRPVCREVNATLNGLPNGAFNFGLYFNKWFCLVDGTQGNDGWKRGKPWSCPMTDETELEKKISRDERVVCHPNQELDNLNVSLALFNGEKGYPREVIKNSRKVDGKQSVDVFWDRQAVQRLLNRRHEMLEQCCNAHQKIGYQVLRYEVTLETPLVIGLGNEHPTEKGFRFDWTLGIPAIPSSGIKGVIRLAYWVNELNRQDDKTAAELFFRDIGKKKLPEAGRLIFGSGETKSRDEKEQPQSFQRGKVIFLDALPTALPRLKAEIMNCHYPDYLNQGASRGPTEDQKLNPQKFWAVDTVVDSSGTPLKFVFRVLVHRDISENLPVFQNLKYAIDTAFGDHGLGAKTSIGHGQFETHQNITAVSSPKDSTREEPQPESIQEESVAEETPLEKFFKELDVIKSTDMGRLGTLIQKIDSLETAEEKKAIAEAVRDKIGPKKFKRHNKRKYLEELMKG
jgi:CRISPR-associated protein Cmr6